MPSDTRNEAVARIVEDALSGLINSEQEFERRRAEINVERGTELASDLHQVQHYVADADIRAREPAYAETYAQTLREILARLRADPGH